MPWKKDNGKSQGADRVHAEPLRLLFVCSRNQWRSPTAEALFRHHPRIQARSGGTSPSAVHRVSSKDIAWADVIFVMESKHRQRLLAEHPEATRYKDIHVLDIPDDFQRDDSELIDLLKASLAAYLPDSDLA